MTDASSEQIAEEELQTGEAGLEAAHPVAESGADLISTTGAAPSESNGENPANSVASPGPVAAVWKSLSGAPQRLIVWGAFVLLVGFLFQGRSVVQPALGSPQERFARFVGIVKQRLPVILYGEDPFGQPLLPVEVQSQIIPSSKTGGPLLAELTFEDASFSTSGQVMYTRYKIDYRWQRDHWQCHNLKCDVERPELSKLDQMDFNAVLAHDSAEKNLEMVKLKRAQAEALLRPHLPLGELLRSSNLY